MKKTRTNTARRGTAVHAVTRGKGPHARKPVTAMVVARPPDKPWVISLDEISILKNAICKGATDEELKFCLAVARRHKLDPFRNQIWFVKYNDRSAEGGSRWVPIVGIGGMRHVAARDHKDFGSADEPEYGPMKEVSWSFYGDKGKFKAPEWARISLWKKGHDHPTVATVFWDEIYPDVGPCPLVRRMPRLMLAKCAEAHGLRRAYPATDGLYIQEELQGREQYTPSGRQIIYKNVPQLEGEKIDPNWQAFLNRLTPEEREKEMAAVAKNTPAQREILAQKLAQAPVVKHETPPEGQETAETSPSAVPCLFVVQLEPNRYEILGRENLIPDLKNILRPHYNSDTKQVIVNDEQLDALKFEYEKHSIQIRPLEKMNG